MRPEPAVAMLTAAIRMAACAVAALVVGGALAGFVRVHGNDPALQAAGRNPTDSVVITGQLGASVSGSLTVRRRGLLADAFGFARERA